MIEVLKMIDDLNEIKKMVDDQKPRYLIVEKCNEKIAGYQNEVDEFEKWAENESKNEQPGVEDQYEMPFPEGYGSIKTH